MDEIGHFGLNSLFLDFTGQAVLSLLALMECCYNLHMLTPHHKFIDACQTQLLWTKLSTTLINGYTVSVGITCSWCQWDRESVQLLFRFLLEAVFSKSSICEP